MIEKEKLLKYFEKLYEEHNNPDPYMHREYYIKEQGIADFIEDVILDIKSGQFER